MDGCRSISLLQRHWQASSCSRAPAAEPACKGSSLPACRDAAAPPVSAGLPSKLAPFLPLPCRFLDAAVQQGSVTLMGQQAFDSVKLNPISGRDLAAFMVSCCGAAHGWLAGRRAARVVATCSCCCWRALQLQRNALCLNLNVRAAPEMSEALPLLSPPCSLRHLAGRCEPCRTRRWQTAVCGWAGPMCSPSASWPS